MKKYILALGGSFLIALSSLALANDVTVFNNSSTGICIFNSSLEYTFIAPRDKALVSAYDAIADLYTTSDNCVTTRFLGQCQDVSKVMIQGKEGSLRIKCTQ